MTETTEDLARRDAAAPPRGRSLLSVMVLSAAAVGAAAVLWATSTPGSSLLLVVLAGWAWVVAGMGWVLLVGSRVSSRTRLRATPRLWAIAGAPIIVVAAAGLVVADAPLRVRWAVSSEAFDQVVDAAAEGRRDDQRVALPTPRRLGAYRVAEAYLLDDGVFIVVEGGGGIMSVEGFAHLPTGPNPMLEAQYEGVDFRALGDRWYVWEASL